VQRYIADTTVPVLCLHDVSVAENWKNRFDSSAQQRAPVPFSITHYRSFHNRHKLKAMTLQGAVIFRKSTLMTLSVCSKESVSLGNDVALSVRWEQTNEFAVNRCSRSTCPNSAVTCFRVQLPHHHPDARTHSHTSTRLWKITCYNLL
jgi:hypothetical protein